MRNMHLMHIIMYMFMLLIMRNHIHYNMNNQINMRNMHNTVIMLNMQNDAYYAYHYAYDAYYCA